jgi:hypothetical protein
MIADFIRYSPESEWPALAFNNDYVMNLKAASIDNHFGENWEAVQLWQVTAVKPVLQQELQVYPNPATDQLHVFIPGYSGQAVQFYSGLGRLVYQSVTDANGEIVFDVSTLNEGIYLVKSGGKTAKVMVVKGR